MHESKEKRKPVAFGFSCLGKHLFNEKHILQQKYELDNTFAMKNEIFMRCVSFLFQYLSFSSAVKHYCTDLGKPWAMFCITVTAVTTVGQMYTEPTWKHFKMQTHVIQTHTKLHTITPTHQLIVGLLGNMLGERDLSSCLNHHSSVLWLNLSANENCIFCCQGLRYNFLFSWL